VTIIARSRDAHAPASMNSFPYRPALDGLRTVAVYLVVLFHAGSDKFQGGFIGVDLFFVLSGFLVTNVLLTEINESGRIRPLRFYARRARRLIPAATLAIVGTSIAMVLVATQLDRMNVRDDATASSLWYANWHFLSRSNDYFAVDDAPSPFLHFWSLSIEEQFYLGFPLLLMLIVLIGRNRVRTIAPALVLATAAGVALQISWSRRDLNHAYYGTDARLYQLLAGAALAAVLRVTVRRNSPGQAWWFAAPILIGTLVGASTWLLDVSPSTRGIVATLLSVAIIGSLELVPGGPAQGLLSLRPMTYLGQISYGTYLWHWPVLIVAGRVLELSPSASFLLSAVGGTALAALSYELVEMPIRRGQILQRLPRATIIGGVGTALIVGLVVAPSLLSSDRTPAVTGASSRRELLIDAGPSPPVDELLAADDDWYNPPPCYRRDPRKCVRVAGRGIKIHLMGDSHARMMASTLRALAKSHGMQFSVSVVASCPWQLGLVTGPPGDPRRRRCEQEKPDAYERIIPALDADVVVVMNHSRGDGQGAEIVASDDGLGGLPVETMFDTATRQSIDALTEGGRRVVLLEPVPLPEFDQIQCMSAAPEAGRCAFVAPEQPGMNERVFRAIDGERDDVFSIDLDRMTCPEFPICSPMAGSLIVRSDKSHLTDTYARSIAPDVFRAMRAAGVFTGVAD